MKRGAPEHPKMRRLARALGCPLLLAVGIIERLLHFVAKYAPRGDVGKFSPQEIADAIEYQNDAGDLVRSLCESGWLDAHDDCQWVLHGWFEHADDATHLALARSLQTFITGQIPRMTRLNKQEREEIEAQFHAHGKRTRGARRARGSARKAHGMRTALPCPPHPAPPPPFVEEEHPRPTEGAATALIEDERIGQPEPSTKKSKQTWISPYFNAWVERYGGEPAVGPLASFLRPLEKKHGPEITLAAWCRYLAATGASFAAPARFASTFGEWSLGATSPSTRRSTSAENSDNIRNFLVESGVEVGS